MRSVFETATSYQITDPINELQHAHILTAQQFTPDTLSYLFNLADQMQMLVEQSGSVDLLTGKIVANVFYEPSTRTSMSFAAATQRLGGQVLAINTIQSSSVSKGESLADTIRTLECYADAIVLRHPEIGAAAEAARWAHKPIINAGDGSGEHPTQALLDAYTVQHELGQIEGLTVAMVGDLRYGRTVHSLVRLLLHWNVTFRFVSPAVLRMPEEILREVRESGSQATEHEDLREVIGDVDVLYMTRIQKERLADPSEYERLNGLYIIDPAMMRRAKDTMILMHPLPRVGEITYSVDDDPRAVYFRQVQNGLYIRMALLTAVLGRTSALRY
jgi:aspartate carbamoyltransferase catalytic subunit